MGIPRIVIAGTQSGVGKTTVSIGLMAALKKAGYTVQGFKVGPDYIDPSYHNMVTGRPSENLDSWMLPPDQIKEVFAHAIKGADIAVIEGVMGFYDGMNGKDDTGSTSQIAKLLNCPVLLVIDCHQIARSAGAVALGFKSFDRKTKIRGIILNNIAGETHAQWCKDSVESSTGLQVVGWLPINKKISLPERHLGLIPTPEKQNSPVISEIAELIKQHINVNQVYDIAKSAGTLPRAKKTSYPSKKLKSNIRIGVAFDEAFNFYYPSNLNLLNLYGAEIVHFSPVHDKTLPKGISGVYIGGGFPEMFLEQLESNQTIRRAILQAAESGMPIYGECAGLMYLTKSIADFNGKNYSMVGALDGKTTMTNTTLIAYVTAKVANSNILSPSSASIRGHEFHNSVINDIPLDTKFAYTMLMGQGIKEKKDGWIKNNVLASYMHIHFAQDKKIVKTFLENCRGFKEKIS